MIHPFLLFFEPSYVLCVLVYDTKTKCGETVAM
jgi:hypothetical protein